ncbi:MAG: hypothetical protein IVW57_04645 [Ktedonobacterales bacterium]|nr:hypothetical protein [Ktedonobacterales bacterium]
MDEVLAPLAAIDAGSNTIHLVVARPTADARNLKTLVDETELVRLGADVAALGMIGPERMRRALEVLVAQAARARALRARALLGIATEGVRAAANGADLLARAAAEAGVRLMLISGEQEAALTYWGATSGAPRLGQRQAVVDLGGGSLELVVGQRTQVLWRVSLPVGSGTLLDRGALSDPPRPDELARVRQFATEALRATAPPLPVEEVIACGGTATTLVALSRRALSTPRAPARGGTDDTRWPGSIGTLSREGLAALLDLLATQPAAAITRRYGIQEARVPLLAPGAMALLAALDRLQAEAMRVSQRGIREGAILTYARVGDGWLEAAMVGVL